MMSFSFSKGHFTLHYTVWSAVGA